MDNQDRLIITKRSKSLKIFPNRWVLPGGKVDFGETMEVACMREVDEEIGLKFQYKG
jgi:8-oxo-dGTP pyrophosphatase MutT (NUDIX family)